MKTYIVVKVYKDSLSYANVVFTTDSAEDAFQYSEIMDRNCDEGYKHHVYSQWKPEV